MVSQLFGDHFAMSSEKESPSSSSSAAAAAPIYYEKGSVELAVETPVMMKRLEKRRQLTLTGVANTGAERLLIVLVGLPARGKSFIARKLVNYLTWRGNQCRIFNVGKYRRQAAAELHRTSADNKLSESNDDVASGDGGDSSERFGCNADFFDESNVEAARLRQKVAEVALNEALEWLEDTPNIAHNNNNQPTDNLKEDPLDNTRSPPNNDCTPPMHLDDNMYFTSGHESHGARRQFHRIAVFDATNSTRERRQWILTECAKADESNSKRTGVLFLESICDDKELLEENLKFKISSSPDFEGMTYEQALPDLEARIQRYEARYEPIDEHHQSYIKIFNLSSGLMVNHIYGRLAKVVLPAIMAWNTGSRPVFLCRAAETKAMETYMSQQQKQQKQTKQETSNGDKFEAMVSLTKRMRSDRLGERGLRFRDALCDFIEKEGIEFMNRKSTNVIHPSKMDTGTSISGLYEELDYKSTQSFPCLVMSSTMPRAIETATWKHQFPVKDVSNLNPLDMGDFSGMHLAEIREQHPEWYEQLKREPFHTRFPGGESYSDLIDRLYSIVIDMEQQLGLALAVGHVSSLQVLVSYFRSTPVHECMDIEIPMHTVLKFEPLRGGGWLESQHPLLPDDPPVEPMEGEELPIWGDSRSCLPRKLSIVIK